MNYASGEKKPQVDASAYVAPSAVLSGEVIIGAKCAVLHGAIITSEGAPLHIGAESVVMENAVLKSSGGGALSFPLRIGERCIIGPHTYVVGASIGNGCFVASGAKIFNGATLEEGSSVALGGIVHIGTRLPAQTRVPMQHIAFGDPAKIYAPEHAEEVHAQLQFWESVFNLPASDDVRAKAAALYANFLRTLHAKDTPLLEAVRSTKPVARRSVGEEPPPQQSADVDGVVDAMMLELQEMEHRRQDKLRKQQGKR